MIRPLMAVGLWLSGTLAVDPVTSPSLWGLAEKYGPFFVLLVLLLWWGREDRKAEREREDAKQKALDEREAARIERSDKRWDETNTKQFEMNERYVTALSKAAEANVTAAKSLEVQDAKRLAAVAEQTRVLSELVGELRSRPCLVEHKRKGE